MLTVCQSLCCMVDFCFQQHYEGKLFIISVLLMRRYGGERLRNLPKGRWQGWDPRTGPTEACVPSVPASTQGQGVGHTLH